MGPFAAAQVVILPFPFSDLAGRKYRPALLVASSERGDWIACQITSNPFSDARAIEISGDDFSVGNLHRVSYARPGKLFTANEAIFSEIVGVLHQRKWADVKDGIIAILHGN